MGNTMEGQNKDPKEILYSSEDILNDSLAGQEKNLFTRVKKTKKGSSRKIGKKQLIIASIVASAIILAGIIVLVVLLANSNSGNADKPGEYEIPEVEPLEEIPEEIKKSSPDPNDDSMSLGDYLMAQVAYINTLLDNNYMDTAVAELDSVFSEAEANIDTLADCQIAAIYKVSLRLEEISAAKAGDTTSEEDTPADEDNGDEDGDVDETNALLERMKKATEACNE